MQRKVIAMVLLAIITLLPGCLSSKKLDKWAAKYGFSQREVLPLTIEDQGLPRVNVEINEQEVKMLFDTGNVVGTQISPRRANKLNLPQINNWQSGEETEKAGETFRVFRAKDFIFAGTNYENLNVYESKAEDITGIITPHILANKRFTIDYQQRIMGAAGTGFPDKPELKQESFPLVSNAQHSRYNALPVIRGKVNGQEVLLQFDTGRRSTCVDKKLVEELDLHAGEKGYRIDNLKLGSFEFSVSQAEKRNFQQLSRGYPEPIRVVIGSDLLAQFVLTVDYKREEVIISES